MADLADRPEAEQVEILRAVAVDAAASFGLDVVRLEPVLVAYNATFRVDEGARSWALRVLVGSHSDASHVAAQQAWQLALAAEADVLVPVPRRTTEGAWQASVRSQPAAGERLVTAAGWLAGDDVGTFDPSVASALGATMARMHDHAEGWSAPAGSSVPEYRDALFGDAPALLDARVLTTAARDVLRRSLEIADAAHARVHAADAPRILHADLHAGNLKRAGSEVAVFDFDDAALAVPALDLAIAAFYGDTSDIRTALDAGYRSVRALPDVDPADLEALVAGRQLLLANDMLGSATASLRAQGEGYLLRAVARLEAWLATGRFSRSVA
ncbi:phosphotransferase [Agrococcus versicolor]|uniref:Phosphotransferase n=1 Tax=Agrococcus versicolor TaxID=501482 RepID=A0ABN3APP7_9MICO